MNISNAAIFYSVAAGIAGRFLVAKQSATTEFPTCFLFRKALKSTQQKVE